LHASVSVGCQTFSVLVADTPSQWQSGMLGQTGVDGMLFTMPFLSQMPFHMKQVDHPILIAFFNENGRLVDAAYMEPETGFHRPRRPFRFALELVAEPERALQILPHLEGGITEVIRE
jgi:uncharacterized membrane protein (UPF0127 family)